MSGFGGFGGFGQNNNNQQQQSTGFGGFGSTNTSTGRSYFFIPWASTRSGPRHFGGQRESITYSNLLLRYRLWLNRQFRFRKHEHNWWWTLRWRLYRWIRKLWRYVDCTFLLWIFLLDSISHGPGSNPHVTVRVGLQCFPVPVVPCFLHSILAIMVNFRGSPAQSV
jgi:hypothetical protein